MPLVMGDLPEPMDAASKGTPPPAASEQLSSSERNRLLSGLTLISAIGVMFGIPFALKAGADFFLPLTAAIVIAITLVPFLEWMERHRVPSALAAFIALMSFLVVANTALVLVIVPAAAWVALLPERIVQIRATIDPIIAAYAQLQRVIDRTVEVLAGPVAAARTAATEAPSSLLQLAATSAPAAILHMLFAVLVIFFFLAGWSSLRRRTIRGRESANGAMTMAHVIQDVINATSRYVLTIATINLLLGAAVAVALWAVGMPSPLMWGGITAILNFIPYLGPIVAAMLIAIGGLMTYNDLWLAFMPVALQISFHLIEANILTPIVLGGRLRMNPLLILISLSFWGWIWGTPGALLAVPLLIIIRTIFAAAGKPDIAGFLFEAGTLTGAVRDDRTQSATEAAKGS